MIEVETQTTEVEVTNNIEVISAGQVEVETVDLSDLDITVAKKEYIITGDDIYIPMLYDDAPQWMKNLVQVVVDVSISSGNQSLINNMNAILQDFAVSYVPLNQYTQSILDLGDEDTRINALITTLNSNFSYGLSTANAQIIEMQLTKASKDEVVAQVIQTIAAQLADDASNIGSTIGRIDQAIATETSARALSLQTLTASLEDTNLDVAANAEVIQNALAYVGIDEAGASTGTGLSAYLEDSNGNIGGADSQLANSIRVTAEGVESKFAYNSVVSINGVYKKSGFGLTTNYISGAGTQANPYVSEFWIDASRLKFTNSNQTGQVAPFTIDATGANPVITFNGKVQFSNINGASMSGSNLLYNSAPTIGIETKGWQADYNTTGIASSGVLASGDPYRPTGGGAFYQSIPGTPAVGRVFDIRAIGAIPVIGGQFYEGSAYLNLHRCDGRIYVGWRDSAGATITWSMGDIVTQTNTTNVLAAWGRSKFIAQAPANAVSCYYYIRGTSTGEVNPYVFVSMCYFGRAAEGQTVYSNWSDGISGGATTTSELTNTAGFTTLGAVASQGYVLPAGVANAINTNTTTVNGSKITTGSITAAQINTVGLIAENISANEIIGKTLTGTVINGARINGSVIKASYLDLDGELEVLTNYHISVAMYNANPSLYGDAVYISADNEYRIPSISTISSLEKVVSSSSSPWVAVGSYTLSSGLYSYATANVGHNMKAVKSRPSIINFSESGSSGGLSNNTLYSAVFDGTTSGYFTFSIGNLLILSLTISNTSVSYSGLVGSGSIAATIGGTTTVNLSYCGMSFVVRRGAFYGMRITVEYLGNTNMSISSDWTSGQIYVTANSVANPSAQNTLIGLRLPAISIDNMI